MKQGCLPDLRSAAALLVKHHQRLMVPGLLRQFLQVEPEMAEPAVYALVDFLAGSRNQDHQLQPARSCLITMCSYVETLPCSDI